MTNKKSIEIRNLFFAREDHYLFSDYSLQVDAGEWISLRGNNGAGKSTLLKLIAGHIPPESGDIWTIPFSFLGHKNGQRCSLTVSGQLKSKMNLVGSTMNLDEVLENSSLHRLKDFPIAKLSAGQQRKVALAEFFFTPEKLWLLDEPLDHLDKDSQRLFNTLFHQHVQLGGTIVQSSHENLPNSYGSQEIWLRNP